MNVISDIADCRNTVCRLKASGRTVGFVPTMGALHAGHVSLIRAARERCGQVVVSIFVNPTQFALGEDFTRYPRPFEADLDVCRREGVDLIFAPSADAVFPPDAKTVVHVRELGDRLCGPFRPGHFDGVATVVAKLFNMVPCDTAFFGEKDYQQLVLICRMVADLNLPVEIVACPTVREADGLAMSSRNAYLQQREREQAVSVSRGLFAAIDRAKRGEAAAAPLTAVVGETIDAAGPATIEYIELVDCRTLERLETLDRPARLCVAVRIGPTRLIDNVPVDPPSASG